MLSLLAGRLGLGPPRLGQTDRVVLKLGTVDAVELIRDLGPGDHSEANGLARLKGRDRSQNIVPHAPHIHEGVIAGRDALLENHLGEM